MFKAIARFGFKKSKKPFKDYYNEWFKTLKNTLLPQLRHAMSSSSTAVGPIVLASHVEVIHRHLLNYYNALDVAAAHDVSQLLYPDWKTPLEKPFLFLGDFHPYLFVNLLRSFISESESEAETEEPVYDPEEESKWHVVMAWKSPCKGLTSRVDQIECGLRLMVPALMARARHAQAAFVERVACEWGRVDGRKDEMKGVVGEAAVAEMEELVGVFVDANRLRRSVLSDILSVTDVYQAAVFLEALAQFLVGFKNRDLINQFDKCSMEL